MILCVRAKNNQVSFQDYVFPQLKSKIVLQPLLKEWGHWGLITFDNNYGGNKGVLVFVFF